MIKKYRIIKHNNGTCDRWCVDNDESLSHNTHLEPKGHWTQMGMFNAAYLFMMTKKYVAGATATCGAWQDTPLPTSCKPAPIGGTLHHVGYLILTVNGVVTAKYWPRHLHGLITRQIQSPLNTTISKLRAISGGMYSVGFGGPSKSDVTITKMEEECKCRLSVGPHLESCSYVNTANRRLADIRKRILRPQ